MLLLAQQDSSEPYGALLDESANSVEAPLSRSRSRSVTHSSGIHVSPGGSTGASDVSPSSLWRKFSVREVRICLEDNVEGHDGAVAVASTKRDSGRGRRTLKRGATSLGVKGGRSVDDVLTRQTARYSDFEGFAPSEMSRMRRAFRLFRSALICEVSREDIQDILLHLGYLRVAPEVLEDIVESVSSFMGFDFPEVVEVVEKCAIHERQRLQEVFDAHCHEQSQGLRRQDLAEVLRALGATPLRNIIDDTLVAAGLELRHHLSHDDLCSFMAFYRVTEGFSRSEVAAAQKVFSSVTTSSAIAGAEPKTLQKALENEMKLSQLPTALQRMFGLHVAEHVKRLVEKLGLQDIKERQPRVDAGEDGSESDDSEIYHGNSNQTIGFHEFLIWAGRIHSAVVEELQGPFRRAAAGGRGVLSHEALLPLMAGLGFSLLPTAIDEFLVEAGVESDQDLGFDEFVSFVQVCRSRSGFRREEADYFATVFARFDYNRTSEIGYLELPDLLRYIGYIVRVEDVPRFLTDTDMDGSGTMDFPEFLRSMRLHREQELQQARAAFNANMDSQTGELPIDSIGIALNALNLVPKAELLRDVLKHLGEPQSCRFDGFIEIADRCRKEGAADRRRKGGFSDKSIEEMQQSFKKHCKVNQSSLEKGGLLWLLMDFNIPVETSEVRKAIFANLDSARAAALHAGLEPEEVGEMASATTTFWTMVHLLRALLRDNESRVLKREADAVQRTGFLPAEVGEFREVFNAWLRRSATIERENVQHGENKVEGQESSIQKRRTSGPDILQQLGKTSPLEEPESRVFKLPPRMSIEKPAELPANRPAGLTTTAPVQSLMAVLSARQCPGDTAAASAPQRAPEQVRGPAQLEGSVDDLESRALSFSALKSLLYSVGLKLSFELALQLKEQAAGISGEATAAVDFPDFLHLMRWMLDKDFADINAKSRCSVDSNANAATLRLNAQNRRFSA